MQPIYDSQNMQKPKIICGMCTASVQEYARTGLDI